MSTPHRRRGGTLSSSPAPTPTVTNCSTDPVDFSELQIHTAKCAICDERNMAMMRRCPGCTYQVCQPCFDARNGAPLIHGNLGADTTGLFSTPVRRRVFNRARPLGTPSAGATGSPVPGAGAGESGELDVEDARAGAQAQAAATAEGPGSRKRARPTREGKGKAKAADSDEESEELVLSDDSADQEPKRQKVMPPKGWKKQTITLRSDPVAPNDGRSNHSLQRLLEEQGIDTPGNRYAEPFLGRYQHVLSDPVIPIPARVRRMVKSPPKAQMMTQAGISNEVPGAVQSLTLHDWIEKQTTMFREAHKTTVSTENMFKGFLTAAILTLLAEFNTQFSVGLMQALAFTINNKVSDFTDVQVARFATAVEKAREQTSQIVDLSKAPVAKSTVQPSSSGGYAGPSSSPLASRTDPLPPLGLFSVSSPMRQARIPGGRPALSIRPHQRLAMAPQAVRSSPPPSNLTPSTLTPEAGAAGGSARKEGAEETAEGATQDAAVDSKHAGD